eukprot:scaffold5056_cov94-Isochrysis_galbana.AAC.1
MGLMPRQRRPFPATPVSSNFLCLCLQRPSDGSQRFLYLLFVCGNVQNITTGTRGLFDRLPGGAQAPPARASVDMPIQRVFKETMIASKLIQFLKAPQLSLKYTPESIFSSWRWKKKILRRKRYTLAATLRDT